METYFKNQKGQSLFRKDYLVERGVDEIKANVVIVHGLHEHSEYYEELAWQLYNIHCNIFTLDLPGHGKSEGERGYFTSIDQFVQDVHQLVKAVKEDHPSLPLIIFGHSMGSLISMKLAIDYPNDVDAIILEAAALDVRDSSHLSFIKLRLKSMFWPRHGEFLLKPEILSHDPEAVSRIKTDPLYHSQPVKCCALYALRSAMETLRNNLARVTQPILVTQGGQDFVCLPSGASTIFNDVSSKIKTLKMFPTSYHQIHNEIEEVKSEFFICCQNWISDLTKPTVSI